MTGVWSLTGNGPEKRIIGGPIEVAKVADKHGYSKMKYLVQHPPPTRKTPDAGITNPA